MNIISLENTSTYQILNAFNLAFSDYMIPLRLSQEQLERKFVAEDIDLSLSMGVIVDGELIGFVLHACREIEGSKVLYNGGTGVVPKYRGNRLTQKMYQFIRAALISNGITKVTLEVIAENAAAIHIYEKIGFRKTRTLNCYKGKMLKLEKNEVVEIQKSSICQITPYTNYCDRLTTWQNELATASNIEKDMTNFVAILNNEIVGYLVYQQKSKKILQLAVAREARNRGIASSLLSNLETIDSDAQIVTNIDVGNNSLNTFLQRRGMELFLKQYEMEWDLSEHV